jgi:hypothetical protein
MKKIMMIAAALITGLLFTESATAGPRGRHSIKHEQIQQQHQIRHGVHTGTLTHREAAQLQRQQAQIQQAKRFAKCDGKVTRCERAYIKAEQARAGQNIYRQKHDHQTR